MKDRLGTFFIFIAFFSSYSGTSLFAYAIFSSFLIINLNRMKFIYSDIIISIMIGLFLFSKMLEVNIQHAFIIARYSFGFYLFYLLLRQKWFVPKINHEIYLLLFSIFVTLEAILINTILPPNMWPNYPSAQLQYIVLQTGYLRPYSIGTNASVTSTLLVVMLFYQSVTFGFTSGISKYSRMLAFLAVILCNSGTGYILLGVYIVLRERKNISVYFASISIGLTILYFESYQASLSAFLYKLSSFYFLDSYELFLMQLGDYISKFNPTFYSLLFGSQQYSEMGEVALGGDLGIVNFIYFTGMSGIIVYSFVILLNYGKFNIIPIIILAIGSMHYGALFTMPGQFIFAYIISTRPGEDARNIVPSDEQIE